MSKIFYSILHNLLKFEEIKCYYKAGFTDSRANKIKEVSIMQQSKRNRKDNADTLRKNLEDKLPKNVRQIGNVSQNTKIYIQEFVLNYLKRIQKDVQQKGINASEILIGEKVVAQKATYFFIIGAIGLGVDVKENNGALSEESKKQITRTIESYFGKENSALCQIGWSSQLAVENKIPDEFEGFHRENFGTGNTLFLGFCEDGEEVFYINENGKLKKQNGYYVYFDRNEGMQQYIEDNQPAKCVEMEPLEKGKSETYRMLLANHKEEIQHKHLVSFLYTASTFLVMVVIVLGVTLINHYDKLKDMQGTIATLSKKVINGESDDVGVVSDDGLSEVTSDNVLHKNSDVSNVSHQGVNVEGQAVQTGASVEAASGETANSSGEATTVSGTGTSAEEGSDGEDGTSSDSEQSLETINDKTVEEYEAEQLAMMQEQFRRYEVVEGDTLIGICRKLYGSLEYLDKICEYNQIENSDQIKVGQKIWVP